MTEMEHLPKIFSCYLTNCAVTFNATQNSFHQTDGSQQAPVEVDMNVTFQETRALTRPDVELMRKMTGNANDPDNFVRRGINQAGLASTMTYDQYGGDLNALNKDQIAKLEKLSKEGNTVATNILAGNTGLTESE